MRNRERNQETTGRIIEAALAVFSEAGFSGARMDEIARRAMVNKATLYYHIGDRKALYTATLHHVIGHTAQDIAASVQKVHPPEQKLRAYVRGFAQAIERNPQMAPIMMRELASRGENFPSEAARDFACILDVVTGILDEGHRNGVFIKATPFIVHMMVVGAVVLFRVTGPIRARLPHFTDGEGDPDMHASGDIIAEMEQLVLNAVVKKDERST
jgi:AcrR family transcriptional regulator